MLYLIGLGLSWKDLSMKALEALSTCEEVFLESYTSVSDFSPLQLQRLIGKPVKVLDRKAVEETNLIFGNSEIKTCALLIYGDPLAATTHQELVQLARKKNIPVKVIHSASVFTAVAETGLSLYRFGKVASVPMPEADFKPESFFDVLADNLKIDAHTLFLLDLKPAEDKFLSIPDAVNILLDIDKKRNANIFTEETFVIACARLGFEDQAIKSGKVSELLKEDFGKAPYCLIVPAKLNHKEEEFLA